MHRVEFWRSPDESSLHWDYFTLGLLLPLEPALVVVVDGILLQDFNGVLGHLCLTFQEFVDPLLRLFFVLVDAEAQILVPVRF